MSWRCFIVHLHRLSAAGLRLSRHESRVHDALIIFRMIHLVQRLQKVRVIARTHVGRGLCRRSVVCGVRHALLPTLVRSRQSEAQNQLFPSATDHSLMNVVAQDEQTAAVLEWTVSCV